LTCDLSFTLCPGLRALPSFPPRRSSDLLVLGVGALDQRDRPGEDGTRTGEHALHVGVDVEGSTGASRGHRSVSASSRSRSSRAASAITVPGPKIKEAPAARSSA